MKAKKSILFLLEIDSKVMYPTILIFIKKGFLL